MSVEITEEPKQLPYQSNAVVVEIEDYHEDPVMADKCFAPDHQDQLVRSAPIGSWLANSKRDMGQCGGRPPRANGGQPRLPDALFGDGSTNDSFVSGDSHDELSLLSDIEGVFIRRESGAEA